MPRESNDLCHDPIGSLVQFSRTNQSYGPTYIIARGNPPREFLYSGPDKTWSTAKGETEETATYKADTINFWKKTGAVMSGPIQHWLDRLEQVQKLGYPDAILYQRNCGVLHPVEITD